MSSLSLTLVGMVMVAAKMAVINGADLNREEMCEVALDFDIWAMYLNWIAADTTAVSPFEYAKKLQKIEIIRLDKELDAELATWSVDRSRLKMTN